VAVGSSFEFENNSIIHGDLSIVTQKGNDNICVHNATIFGAMAINAGDGSNEVSGENFDAAAVSIVTGKQNDDISLDSFNVDTAVAIYSGDGSDEVTVDDFDAGEGDGPNALPVKGGGSVSIVTDSAKGTGSDFVRVTNFDLHGSMSIVTYGGNDEVEVSNEVDSTIDGADDDDIIGNVVINTGNGNDDVELGGGANEEGGVLDIVGNLVVALGAGNDFLRAEDVFAFQSAAGAYGNATIDAGAGNDDVEISDSTFDTITTILMGSGNDFLSIFGSGGGTAIATLIADGGSGKDTFDSDITQEGPGSDIISANGNYQHDSNGVPHVIIRNFETFEIDDLIATDVAIAKKGW